ncbi:MAG: hypothetical protein ALECFALPRED_003384 [Alectoria fallacina]|uniref:AB hydrolase-1 domain-containing protein n=1 Tax=Alectoria fallacina TaxID=1903189 RepID=A0A8H3IFK2_9LECA|nr:MAG: hypothetical protein ALECFALPRED_003384 [Alectoria fallacina]
MAPTTPLSYPSTYNNITVSPNTAISYISAGSPALPILLLLHGFPSSSNQFRNLIPLLSTTYHVLAPDLPGFGLTIYPSDYVFTFENLSLTISAFLTALNINSYAVYIFDYGAPVGLRLALANPSSIKAIISQNGNAYVEGLGHPFWNPIEALWADPSPQNYEIVRNGVLTLEATVYQYTTGVPSDDLPLVNPAAYTYDYLKNLQTPADQDHQLALFYDYRNNVAKYPAFQAYFRQSQVPLLAVWGRNDPAFVPAGAEAFKRDLPSAEVNFVDAGHFALETKVEEIAEETLKFLKRIGY